MSLESKKLRLQPPIATPTGPRDVNGASQTRREEDTEVEVTEES
jgi:hypothetical protein